MAKQARNAKALAELIELERELRGHNFYKAANCLARFLKGEAQSLDEAFGVTARKKRGRPKVREQRHLAIAQQVLAFRLSTKASRPGAIGAFESKLAEEFHLSDPRKVREIFARYQNAVMVEELLRRRSRED